MRKQMVFTERSGAIGAVVAGVQDEGNEFEGTAVFAGQIDPSVVSDPWVRENIVPVVDLPRYESREALLEAFWAFWLQYRDGATCVADFGAPVAAGLFRACIEQDFADGMWKGPYPMHELGTVLLLAGIDPDGNRREFVGRPDLVQHDPVDDPIAVALCWKKLVPTTR